MGGRLQPKLLAASTAALALVPALAHAEPPDFGLSVDLAPTVIVDPYTGQVDPYLGLTFSGSMSGTFDNGFGYIVSADAIHEGHSLYPTLDLNYLRFSAQINRQTSIGKLRLKATNNAIFDREFDRLIYNLTDVSLGVDSSFDLTDDLTMRLAFNAARRFSNVRSLDRYSLNPSVAFYFPVFGLDVSLTASYAWRDFVFRERVDHFFSAGASLSKTIGDFTIGMNVSLEANHSSVSALSATSIIIGPNFTYSLPID
jgi:hypothetical protein